MAASMGGSFQPNMYVVNIDAKSYIVQEQRPLPPSPPSLHTILIPTLVTFLKLKYDGKEISPFETHPKTMLVAITSFLLYCYSTPSKPIFYGLICRGSELVGSVCVMCLVSVLFPNSIELVLYMLYSVVLAGELLCQLRMISGFGSIGEWPMVFLRDRATVHLALTIRPPRHRPLATSPPSSLRTFTDNDSIATAHQRFFTTCVTNSGATLDCPRHTFAVHHLW
ncbi:hypothetical protein U1Q18_019331 [Sarracenia purpurea var. burkii]